MPTCNPEHLR